MAKSEEALRQKEFNLVKSKVDQQSAKSDALSNNTLVYYQRINLFFGEASAFPIQLYSLDQDPIHFSS